MQEPFKSRKKKVNLEINWNIREIFSEAALDNFYDELDMKNPSKEKI